MQVDGTTYLSEEDVDALVEKYRESLMENPVDIDGEEWYEQD